MNACCRVGRRFTTGRLSLMHTLPWPAKAAVRLDVRLNSQDHDLLARWLLTRATVARTCLGPNCRLSASARTAVRIPLVGKMPASCPRSRTSCWQAESVGLSGKSSMAVHSGNWLSTQFSKTSGLGALCDVKSGAKTTTLWRIWDRSGGRSGGGNRHPFTGSLLPRHRGPGRRGRL